MKLFRRQPFDSFLTDMDRPNGIGFVLNDEKAPGMKRLWRFSLLIRFEMGKPRLFFADYRSAIVMAKPSWWLRLSISNFPKHVDLCRGVEPGAHTDFVTKVVHAPPEKQSEEDDDEFDERSAEDSGS